MHHEGSSAQDVALLATNSLSFDERVCFEQIAENDLKADSVFNRFKMIEYLLPIAALLSTAFSIFLLCLPSRYTGEPENASNDAAEKPKPSVQILVLGDIGRSPRMQYHAMSVAKHGGQVKIIGYQDSTLHPGLINNSNVQVIALPNPPAILATLRRSGVPFLLTGPLKVLHQVASLIHILGYQTKPSKYLIVQNPPTIPTLIVALLVCFFRNTRLIIDWHNYGWTILASTKGANHPLVKLSKLYEEFLGRYADINFTVTHAMKKQLERPPYNIKAPILGLHDRPAEIFQPITATEERLNFLKSLPETADYASTIVNGDMGLLVSSTSWTPDEDFSILLSALQSYSEELTLGKLPVKPLLVMVTGKGPQKETYLKKIASLREKGELNNITILTPWLTAQNYANLLASADLGVCLHMSSSGVDLPMKVVDMFGSGLPVVGYGAYESWPELVTNEVNGMSFETADELADLLKRLLSRDGEAFLDRLKEGAMKEGSRRWDDEWDSVAGRVVGFCD